MKPHTIHGQAHMCAIASNFNSISQATRTPRDPIVDPLLGHSMRQGHLSSPVCKVELWKQHWNPR